MKMAENNMLSECNYFAALSIQIKSKPYFLDIISPLVFVFL